MRIRPYLRCAGRLSLLPLICLSLRAAHASSATWNTNPASNEWNIATNWTPAKVPNGTNDTAIFGPSNTTNVFNSHLIDLASLVFTAGAPSYTITTSDRSIIFVGDGVHNDSEVEQTLEGGFGFNGNSNAGDNVTYIGSGGFSDNASAGSASFYVTSAGIPGIMTFFGNSTAADATIVAGPSTTIIVSGGDDGHPSLGNAQITLLGGDEENSGRGYLSIDGGAIIDDATLIAEPATAAGGKGGTIAIYQDDLTGGTFVANGGAVSGGLGGSGGTILVDSPGIASDGTYTVNGATAAGGESGVMSVEEGSSAGAAFITLNGGENGGLGGKLKITQNATGGTARVAAYGNGLLNINIRVDSTTIGSIEGGGLVSLGQKNLMIGSNNLNTTFSGTIQDAGSISKIGSGTLTLTGSNTYTGGTTLASGILLVSNTTGSGTGTGAVSVSAGTLGGSGIIAGTVTVGARSGTGASLAPSKGVKKPATLTIQGALTLNDDSTYLYKLDTKRVKADEVAANGVTIDIGAKFSLRPSGNNALTSGQVFTVISNTSESPIAGTFHNLPEGKILTVNGSNLQASYTGGDGNDLTLMVVP
jgi:autotransporter-associated beta strand protein